MFRRRKRREIEKREEGKWIITGTIITDKKEKKTMEMTMRAIETQKNLHELYLWIGESVKLNQ